MPDNQKWCPSLSEDSKTENGPFICGRPDVICPYRDDDNVCADPNAWPDEDANGIIVC